MNKETISFYYLYYLYYIYYLLAINCIDFNFQFPERNSQTEFSTSNFFVYASVVDVNFSN